MSPVTSRLSLLARLLSLQAAFPSPSMPFERSHPRKWTAYLNFPRWWVALFKLIVPASSRRPKQLQPRPNPRDRQAPSPPAGTCGTLEPHPSAVHYPFLGQGPPLRLPNPARFQSRPYRISQAKRLSDQPRRGLVVRVVGCLVAGNCVPSPPVRRLVPHPLGRSQIPSKNPRSCRTGPLWQGPSSLSDIAL